MIQRGQKGEQRPRTRGPQRFRMNGAKYARRRQYLSPRQRMDIVPIVIWVYGILIGQRLCWPTR